MPRPEEACSAPVGGADQVSRRSYGQRCGIARSLDLLGERWTLLIIRDLLVAPRRYSDLLDALPGIGTNLLADRLQLLERRGLVRKRRVATPESRVVVYELTESGRALEPVLHELVRWSWKHLDPPHREARGDPRWTILALRARFRREAAAGVAESYQLEIGDQVFHAEVDDGTVRTGEGPAANPAVILRADDETLSAIAAGRIEIPEAISNGRLELEGEDGAIRRFFRIFSRGGSPSA
jgi:DNA-binding HxlR family transcriptional regulator